ncbi:MAG: helicase C-terminal domain-containing protein [Thermoplasmatota archaeon]
MGKFCKRCGTLLRPGKDKSYCPKCNTLVTRNSHTTKGQKPKVSKEGLFPFQKIREGQKQFMKDSERVFKKNKVLLAHAPTGIGKTAAVLTSAVKSKNNDQKIFFLTSKQSQHRIAVDTIKNISSSIYALDIISKQHMCPREESRLPYPVFERFCKEKGKHYCNLYNNNMNNVVERLRGYTRHVDKIVDVCSSRNVCPHKAALEAGKEADIIVCDYNYIFSDIQEQIMEQLGLALENCIIIVDEAHNLPDRVRSHLEESISLQQLQEAFNLLNAKNPSLASCIKRLALEFNKLNIGEQPIEKKFLDKLIDNSLKSGLGQYPRFEDFLKELETAAGNLIEKDSAATAPWSLFSFFAKWDKEGTEIYRAYHQSPPTFRVGLLDPAMLTEDIFHYISSAVLMSGTLYPGEMYADLLGIKNPIIKEYSSPFPKENRKIVSVNNLTTSYKERDLQMFQAYANSISDVVNNVDGNIAAFFPSYHLMEKVADRLELVHLNKNLLIEDKRYSKKEKENLVNKLKRTEKNLLLGVQGGSLSEGVDYNDNILSAVIIAGIPFPPPTIELDALQEYYEEKFGRRKGYDYTRIYPALNRVLQAAGRCIRSKSDKGLILLMDKRFNYDRYKNKMPDEFSYRPTNNLKRECEKFFGSF